MKNMRNKRKLYTPIEIAERLLEVERNLAAIELSKQPLMEQKEKLRKEMLTTLQVNRLEALETGGVTFTRAFRASLSISNPSAALEWAIAHDCAKVELVKANKVLRGLGALPVGFEQEETEYLRAEGIKDIIQN